MSGGQLVIPLVDEGLGNSAYLVDLGQGRALAVDATRDLRALHEAARGRGLTVAFAADTHLHADFLSGARDLAAGGARLVASATGGRQFPHEGLADGDEVDLGGLILRALSTPGHTDEHVSYELVDGATVLGVFTGGSLIVGSAARTDLSGPGRTEELARAQWRSLQRLLTLPEATAVWPTHGAGSFCAAPPGAERTSTIGREKATNPLLAVPDEDTFVTELVSRLGTYPPYFGRLPELNRRGPRLLSPTPHLHPVPVADAQLLLRDGAQLVDVRPVAAFAAGHIPGAVSIALRPQFATWLGWVLDAQRPVLFVRDPDQDPEEILWQALKVGVEQLAGEIDGGMQDWVQAGLPVTTTTLLAAEDLGSRTVLDVRQHAEFVTGHLPSATHLELGELADRRPNGPTGAVTETPEVVMCGHGERAMTAASLLERTHHHPVSVVVGGPEEWSSTTGNPLRTGP
jgi:hydroxyacylglutathione hydrolase